MSLAGQDKKRVGQSTYWIYFGANIVVAGALLIYAVYSFLSLDLATAVTCLLATIPLGIYFRVIMMRRCRDIGWPAILPWLTFGAAVVVSAKTGSMFEPDMASPMSAFRVLGIINLLDFVLMIAIGCMGSKAPVVPGQPGPVDYAKAAPGSDAYASDAGAVDHDSWDAAIAKRLAALAETPDAAAPQAGLAAAPSFQRPATGFGRKRA